MNNNSPNAFASFARRAGRRHPAVCPAWIVPTGRTCGISERPAECLAQAGRGGEQGERRNKGTSEPQESRQTVLIPDLQDEVRKLSREAGSDVDSWITQARQLQDDIKRSQETAKEIVQQAEEAKENTARVQDAASKLSLLHTEIAYNETLAQVVEQLRDISTLLDSAQNASAHGHTIHALQTLEDAEGAFQRLGAFETTRAVGVLKNKKGQLKKTITNTVTESWNSLVVVDTAESKISLHKSVEGKATANIDDTVEALTKLELLDSHVARLSRDLDKIIVSPRLVQSLDNHVTALSIQGNHIQQGGRLEDGNVKAALEEIHDLVEYLNTHLPASVVVPLSAKLVPVIAARLISNLLLPAVPVSTEGLLAFQDVLSYVLGLAEYLDELGWSGQSRLTDWVDKSGEIWLSKQKEAAIAKVQTLFPKKVRQKNTVERVETQVISRGDALHTGDDEEKDDEWGAEWGDEDNNEKDKAQDVEEEDMSAWGEEEEEFADEAKKDVKPEKKPSDDDFEEDWGAEWGDDDDTKTAARLDPTAQTPQKPKHNRNPSKQIPSANKEVTLRETYTVTEIPDSVMEIILQVLDDVAALNSPELSGTAFAPVSGGLFAIPSLLLAMYRATAGAHYSKDIAGNMLIYNDCQRLSDRLREFLQDRVEQVISHSSAQLLQAATRLKTTLVNDIKTIDVFGKRAYGREMESQRQIIRDHLEDTQGFQGCTNLPFSTVCDDAIATTIDRIADVKRQWQSILSHSALLQSLGSLVSTVLTKFVNDVEDMSDITEEESKKLHSYCVSLSTLSQHFQTEDGSGELRDSVGIYTPTWLKFKYLGEILDSSLADIKYLWTDAGLKLEMEAEEVISLIEALFAHSDYRRKAIADIRRTSMH